MQFNKLTNQEKEIFLLLKGWCLRENWALNKVWYSDDHCVAFLVNQLNEAYEYEINN